MKQPYIGVIVHYVEPIAGSKPPEISQECHAAVVTDVLSADGLVDLMAIGGSGFTSYADVEMLEGSADSAATCGSKGCLYPGGSWHWPVIP